MRYQTHRLLFQSLLNAAHTGPSSTVPVCPLTRVPITPLVGFGPRTLSVLAPASSYTSAVSPGESLFGCAAVKGEPLPWFTHHDVSVELVALYGSNATRLTCVSKCRCSPVELPDVPTPPICSPAAMKLPIGLV